MSPKRIDVVFFRTAAGGEPVRDWIKSLEVEDRRAIGQDLQRVEYRWPIGMPLCRAMGDGLYEVRTGLSGGRIARLFFCVDGERQMVLLHALLKKQRKTPAVDLDVARRNKRIYEAGK